MSDTQSTNADLGNESKIDSHLSNKNTGEKKMEKNTGMKMNDIDTLLFEDDSIPNKNLIDQYNRKKAEARKLRARLERLADEINVLGKKIKNN